MTDTDDRQFPIPRILQPGEVLESHAVAGGSLIVVTGRRLVVLEDEETVLDLPFDELRRIQFDIERDRDATLVIVPEHVNNWPRVVTVPLANLRETAATLARIGERINDFDEQQTGRSARVDPRASSSVGVNC